MRDWRGTGAAAERRQEAHRGLYYWHSSVRGCRGVWRVCTAVSASECLCAVSAAAIVRLCVSCVMCTLFVSLRSSHIDTPHCTRQIHTRQDTRAECTYRQYSAHYDARPRFGEDQQRVHAAWRERVLTTIDRRAAPLSGSLARARDRSRPARRWQHEAAARVSGSATQRTERQRGRLMVHVCEFRGAVRAHGIVEDDVDRDRR